MCTIRFWNNFHNTSFHYHNQKIENLIEQSFGSRKPKGQNYLMLIFVEVSFKNRPSRDTGNIRHKTRNEDKLKHNTNTVNLKDEQQSPQTQGCLTSILS